MEDTVATLPEIEARFGGEVARLVDGVTKLSLLELQSDDTRQAENFRKLLLASSQDIRVLLIKLADRLHNMRTLHFVPSPAKRRRTAAETMEIYAPLAERIGMQHVKDELDELSFGQLYPDAAASIENRLGYLRETSGDVIPRSRKGSGRFCRRAGWTPRIRPRQARLFGLAKDAAQECRVRPDVRCHGVPRRRCRNRGLLSRARHYPYRLRRGPRNSSTTTSRLRR